jgi:DNA-binding NarL/FixJ family response regulator
VLALNTTSRHVVLSESMTGARVWRTGRRREATESAPLTGWTVLMCLADPQEVPFLREWIADHGGLALRARSHAEVLRFLAANGKGPTMIIIGAEADGNTVDEVARCMELRAASPGTPILFLSPDLTANDLSTERMAMCDVSLRTPVSQSAFQMAVLAAIANNRFYCRRMAPHLDTPAADAALSPARLARDGAGSRRMTSGWWLLPAVMLGGLLWLLLLARWLL